MSNTTDAPKKQGQRRRRRRGGKNRNNNKQNQGQSNRSQGGNKGGEGRPRRRRSRRKPIQLSWWDKVLIAIGLKEDPNKRGGRDQKSSKQSGKAPKSNTRNARSKEEGGESPRPDSTSKRAKRDKPRKGGDPSTVKSNRVYVGNLSYDTTEEDLKELFKGVGNVRAVEIVYNRNTHRSKGYGFVDMMNKEDAIRSVEVLHDQPFMGRNITVSGAKSKGQEEDEDNEAAMEIKASDIELAPLPEQNTDEQSPEAATEEESGPDAEPTIEEATEPVAETAAPEEAPAEGESSQEERKQD